MRKHLWVLFGGLFLFFFFIFFSYLVDKDFLRQFDFDTTVRLQDNISRRFDDFFSFFSTVGSFEVLVTLLVIILVIKRKIIGGLATFFLFGLFHIIEIFGKSRVENFPPPEFLIRTHKLVEFPQFHVRTEFSYPSGHSGRTVFLSVLLILFIWSSKRLPMYLKLIFITAIVVFAGIMLVSRVYLGEHWATDVIGGTILGMSFGMLSFATYTFTIHKLQK